MNVEPRTSWRWNGRSPTSHGSMYYRSTIQPPNERVSEAFPSRSMNKVDWDSFDYFSKTIERRHEGVSNERRAVLSQRRQVLVHWIHQRAVMRVSIVNLIFQSFPFNLQPNHPRSSFSLRAEDKMFLFASVREMKTPSMSDVDIEMKHK